MEKKDIHCKKRELKWQNDEMTRLRRGIKRLNYSIKPFLGSSTSSSKNEEIDRCSLKMRTTSDWLMKRQLALSKRPIKRRQRDDGGRYFID